MPQRLLLTQNAQFYRVERRPTNRRIREILDAASSNRDGSRYILDVFRESRVLADIEESYSFSVRVFRTKRPVHFFDDDVYDLVYAFVLIVETSGYVAILKKGCGNISSATGSSMVLVSSGDMLSAVDDSAAEFQKIAVRNMTMSGRAIRARAYEAADLRGLVSTHSAGRSIPYFMRMREGAAVRSVSLSTGRIVELSDRLGLDDVVAWVRRQISSLDNPIGKADFLGAFAQHVELSVVVDKTQPSAVLIELSPLKEKMEEGRLRFSYRAKSGKKLDLHGSSLRRVMRSLEKVYEVGDDLEVRDVPGGARVKVNKKSITIAANVLSRTSVIENEIEVSLREYVAKRGLLSVSFADPRYMYFMGSCFYDRAGLSEIPSVLKVLVAKDELAVVRSEKGELSEDSECFQEDTVFHAVETMYAGSGLVFCDDLGDEWADHIVLDEVSSCICFVHSKHGEISTSASNLHDVVGQAIKNLGNMFFSAERFLEKAGGKFAEPYSKTKINRVRAGDYDRREQLVRDLLANHSLRRECVLSCSFLSKADIEEQFNEMRQERRVRGHVVQLFWILSSFIHAAREMNVVPLVYCRP